MKELIWKLRYFYAFRKHSRLPFGLCWEAASIAVCETDWREYDPQDAAREELSYWTD